MEKDKIGLGIIGAGVIAEFHTRAAQQSQYGKVVAVSDVNLERAKKFTDEFAPDAKPYGSAEQMVKDPNVQIVCICTPSGMHSDMTVLAAEAGKHVLTEKPLDITDKKMTRMIDICRKKGVKLGAVFQRRTYEASKKVKKAVESGILGKLVVGNLSQKNYRSQQYYDSGDWRGTWKLDGGGACMNQSVHGIDLLIWLMGDVESVYAYADHLVRNIEVEDTAVAALKFKNGAFGTLTCTTSCNPGEVARACIHGSKGTIIFEDQNIVRWAVSEDEETVAEDIEQPQEPSSGKVGQGVSDPRAIDISGHIVYIDDMAKAVMENRDPICTGEDARRSVDLILAIYKSAQTGKEVRL